MAITSKGPARRLITRYLAAATLLGIYVFSTIGMTGVVMTTGVSPAMARGRGGRGGGRGRGNVGAAIGAGVAIGIIGGAIAADQARRQNSVEYCMSRFRSYNPNTGTYIGRDGYEHPCP
jgi:hypothetical protein